MASKQKIVAVLCLLSAALVWGLMWYPYRVLQNNGVPAELATLLSYTLALVIGVIILGPVWKELRFAGWWGISLTLCAGWTNLGYVLAVLNGEVMRVLLLFYLAPLWTVIFARLLLGERLNRYGYAVIALSLAGVFAMLWHPQYGMPMPQNAGEWIGLSAGLTFALTNVLVRRLQHLSIHFKSLTVWFGTAALTLLVMLSQGQLASGLPVINLQDWLLLVLLGLILCATSLLAQHGLTLLPANQSIILFLSELVFAAISSYLLAGEVMGPREITGAMLIISASLLSGKIHAEPSKP
ncbi:MAG: DMT family transporter [Gallionellaceae bacterium]|nr:DMT family transporter [Gallionellaceae bacterium]